MEKIVKIAHKKEAVYFRIELLITKCMWTEIKGDEKLPIDLEWPKVMQPTDFATFNTNTDRQHSPVATKNTTLVY